MPSPVKPIDFRNLISDPTASLCGNFVNTLLKLPVKIYEFINWMLDSDGNLTDDFKDQISGFTTPTGTIRASVVSETIDGWLLCDGSAKSRTTYAALFAKIGTTFGEGDAVSTFNLPDFRGKFLVGVGQFESGATITLGTELGAEKVELTVAQMPEHSHQETIKVSTDTNQGIDDYWNQSHEKSSVGDSIVPTGTSNEHTAFYSKTAKVGGGDEHDNIPPAMGVHWYIAT